MRPNLLPTLLVILLPAAGFPQQEAEEKKQVRHRLPAMSSVFPQGAVPGARLRTEVLGEQLDRTSAVVFLDPSIRGRILHSEATRLDLEFEVDAEAFYGPHYFRTVSPRGASNILLFRVGDQPHRVETEPNSTASEASEVTLPVTMNGRLDRDGDFDFYRFRARAGESWIFDLRAARNGNGLDAALFLLDENGRRLAYSEDHFIWDPFLDHTFSRDGLYLVVVQPTHARMDPNFAYQLDIRAAPHLKTMSPIGLAPGTTTEVTLFGAGLREGSARLSFDAGGVEGELLEARGTTATARIRVAPDARAGERKLVLITAGGRSNPVRFLVEPVPSHAGGEVLRAPVSLYGTARYRQPERFVFDVQAGQTLAFEVRAHRFGSAADCLLRILDEKGKQLAVNDDAAFAGVGFNKDPRIVHKFAEAGRYQLQLRNLWQVTGEDFPYQLLVGPPQPGVELMLATDQPYVYAGESRALKVTLTRKDGFDGEIPLRVSGLPEGVTAEPVTVPAGKNEGEIQLTAVPLSQGTHAEIRVESPAASAPAWRMARLASGGGEGATEARVDRALLVVAEKPGFSLEATLNNASLARGGALEVPVAITRAADFRGEIHFRAMNLPAGVRLEPATAAEGAEKVTIVLKAEPGAKAGRYPRVAILGSTSDGHTQEAPKITIVVD